MKIKIKFSVEIARQPSARQPSPFRRRSRSVVTARPAMHERSCSNLLAVVHRPVHHEQPPSCPAGPAGSLPGGFGSSSSSRPTFGHAARTLRVLTARFDAMPAGYVRGTPHVVAALRRQQPPPTQQSAAAAALRPTPAAYPPVVVDAPGGTRGPLGMAGDPHHQLPVPGRCGESNFQEMKRVDGRWSRG